MTDRNAVLARLARGGAVLAGLVLLAGVAPAQEAEFERLWSHDTGG